MYLYFTGCFLILAGVGSIIGQVLILTFTKGLDGSILYFDKESWSTGIWAGTFIFLAGVFGILYGKSQTKARRTNLLVFSSLSIAVSIAQVAIASIKVNDILSTKDVPLGWEVCNFTLNDYCSDHLIFNGLLVGCGVVGVLDSAIQLIAGIRRK